MENHDKSPKKLSNKFFHYMADRHYSCAYMSIENEMLLVGKVKCSNCGYYNCVKREKNPTLPKYNSGVTKYPVTFLVQHVCMICYFSWREELYNFNLFNNRQKQIRLWEI